MKNNRWEVAQGASNLGEDDEKVAVLKVDGTSTDNGIIKICYCAYSGLKILELTGLSEVIIEENPDKLIRAENIDLGLDWEVSFTAKVPAYDERVTIVIDDCEFVTILDEFGEHINGEIGEVPQVVSSEEYMVDQYEELDIELLKIFCYI